MEVADTVGGQYTLAAGWGCLFKKKLILLLLEGAGGVTVYVDCLDIRVEEGYADEDDQLEDKNIERCCSL